MTVELGKLRNRWASRDVAYEARAALTETQIAAVKAGRAKEAEVYLTGVDLTRALQDIDQWEPPMKRRPRR